MAQDPVCGMKVSENGANAPYGGKTYYFCCSGSRNAFERDPEKYTTKA